MTNKEAIAAILKAHPEITGTGPQVQAAINAQTVVTNTPKPVTVLITHQIACREPPEGLGVMAMLPIDGTVRAVTADPNVGATVANWNTAFCTIGFPFSDPEVIADLKNMMAKIPPLAALAPLLTLGFEATSLFAQQTGNANDVAQLSDVAAVLNPPAPAPAPPAWTPPPLGPGAVTPKLGAK